MKSRIEIHDSLCGRPIDDVYWQFCGETDMGQTLPVMCEACHSRLLEEGCDLSEYGAPYPLREMPVGKMVACYDADGNLVDSIEKLQDTGHFSLKNARFVTGMAILEDGQVIKIEYDDQEGQSRITKEQLYYLTCVYAEPVSQEKAKEYYKKRHHNHQHWRGGYLNSDQYWTTAAAIVNNLAHGRAANLTEGFELSHSG